MSDNEQRYKEALEKIRALTDKSTNACYQTLFSTANEALYPQPQYEEVEVVAWKNVDTDEVYSELHMRPYSVSDLVCVKCVGTYQRPVKPKVKHRYEIGEVSNGYGGFEYLPNRPNAPRGAKIFLEWEE